MTKRGSWSRLGWLGWLGLALLVAPQILVAQTRTSLATIQARIDAAQTAGAPVVVHVVVALCDNLHQGIVPVPAALGNGQDARSNLYWGALYGVRTHLLRSGFELHRVDASPADDVLERVVLGKTVRRSGRPLEVVVVAEAWDGRAMEKAIARFLSLAAGRDAERVRVDDARGVQAGGAATVVAFVGHNGLMDVPLGDVPEARPGAPARGSIVLACASKPYFLDALHAGGSHPLLLTTGLMAPEAYTLDAALTALLEGADAGGVHEAAAKAYDAYQKCGLRGARRLFYSE